MDANVVFSALITKGKSFDVFLLNKLVRKYEFIAPEYLFTEIGKHFDKILKGTKLPMKEVTEVFAFIKDEIKFIPFSEFKEFAEEAERISPDPDDVPYFALSVKFNRCPILSGDPELRKQSEIEILSPAKVLEDLKKEFV